MDAAVEVSLSGRKMKRAFVDTVKTQLRQHGTVKIVLPRAGAFPRYGLVHMRFVYTHAFGAHAFCTPGVLHGLVDTAIVAFTFLWLLRQVHEHGDDLASACVLVQRASVGDRHHQQRRWQWRRCEV